MTEPQVATVCDFCTAGTIRWVYLAEGFTVRWDPPAMVGDTTFDAGGWGACRPCAKMIDANDLDGLIGRAIRGVRLRETLEEGTFPTSMLDRHFRPLFTKLLQLKSARKTVEETKHLQAHEGDPMGIAIVGDKLYDIMENPPLDKEMGLGRDRDDPPLG